MNKQLFFVVGCFLVGASGAPEARFSCMECVEEMHNLANLMHDGAEFIKEYLIANYCPTLDDDQTQCEKDLGDQYVRMLGMIVNHFFVDGATHVCQTMGVCEAAASRKITCEECVQGLEWVKMYMEDPIQIAEYVVYLEQNFCVGQVPHCPDVIAQHFPPMHLMAMDKFMIPIQICNNNNHYHHNNNNHYHHNNNYYHHYNNHYHHHNNNNNYYYYHTAVATTDLC